MIPNKAFNLFVPRFPRWYHEVVGLGDLKVFSKANISSILPPTDTSANENLITNYPKQWKIQVLFLTWEAGGW